MKVETKEFMKIYCNSIEPATLPKSNGGKFENVKETGVRINSQKNIQVYVGDDFQYPQKISNSG